MEFCFALHGFLFVIEVLTQKLPTGIDRRDVESMETRLKRDVLAEATQYGNQILVPCLCFCLYDIQHAESDGPSSGVTQPWSANTEHDHVRELTASLCDFIKASLNNKDVVHKVGLHIIL